MWTLDPSDEYIKAHKWFAKKRKKELAAVLANLEMVRESLERGLTIEQVSSFGFVHHEPQGVLAIDQKGGGNDLRQTRLYILVQICGECIKLLTIGDKATQHEDIKYATRVATELNRGQ